MELLEHPYYALNKRLLVLIGQWPNQSKNERRYRAWLINILLHSFSFVETALIITSYGEMEAFADAMMSLSILLLCTVKYYTVHFNMDHIKNLLNRVIDNWNLWKSKEELDIMHKFGQEGKTFTFWYTTYIYFCTVVFLMLPLLPRFMDQIVPLNESRPLRPLLRGEYFIDENEYFRSIYIHMSVTTVIAMTVVIATDTLFLVFNSHICGVFAALGHYLENTSTSQPHPKSSSDCLSRRQSFKRVVYSVEVHKKALEFSKLLETAYSISLLQQTGLSLICMSVSLFQVLIKLEKLSEAFKFIASATGQLLHLFCICYPGQRMIDYSTKIQFQAYSGLWYKAPSKVSKLVLLIIQRSLEPCYLTAGKIFIFCLESYLTILQTAISYFMVLSSFKQF